MLRKNYLVFILCLLLLCTACAQPQEPPAPEVPQETAETPTDAPTAEKTQLVLGVIRLPEEINWAVKCFNCQSDGCKVVVRDYAAETESLDQARQVLNTELLAGQGPDMICFTFHSPLELDTVLSPLPFLSRGWLLDMKPYLDRDPNLKAEDIAGIQALQEYGGLYLLSPTFAITTMGASPERFGGRTGWSIQEYLDLEASLEDGVAMSHTMDPALFLYRIGGPYVRETVDLEEGTCDFENETFVEILNAAARCSTYDYTKETLAAPKGEDFRGVNERILLDGTMLLCNDWPNVELIAMDAYQTEGKHMQYIGNPTPDGSCGSDLMPMLPVGVSSRTAHPAACWEFVKFMVMNPMIDAIHLDNPTYIPKFGEVVIAINQDSLRQFKAAFRHAKVIIDLAGVCEHMGFYDEDILDIIQEEAAPLFRGETTAEEVARKVQSRASIYMAEQYG